MWRNICNRIVVSSLKGKATSRLHLSPSTPKLLFLQGIRRPLSTTVDSHFDSEKSQKAGIIDPSQAVSIQKNISEFEGQWQEIGGAEDEEEFDEFKGISLKRGLTGVFDIEEFVDILRLEKLNDIAVIAVAPDLQYVDFMVISTGKSARQVIVDGLILILSNDSLFIYL